MVSSHFSKRPVVAYTLSHGDVIESGKVAEMHPVKIG